MHLTTQSIKQSLNYAFRRQAVDLADYQRFTHELSQFLENIRAAGKSGQTEEHLKNLLKEFLNKSLYHDQYAINPKALSGNVEIDLAVHNGKKADAPVGVLMEVKKPENKGEMISTDNFNKKAFQEAVLYYLWEKEINQNHELKHIVITNLYEWFVFDAMDFNKLFYQDKKLLDHIRKWKDKQLDNASTRQMHGIIETVIQEKKDDLPVTHFDLREYEQYLSSALAEGSKSSAMDTEEALTPLLKILAPQHLLKQSFENDSNSLNEAFYKELLYILGLKEQKEGNKKLIQRDENGPEGSLLENTISRLSKEGVVDKPELNSYGETREDRLFNIALELCITWMNRILFLKLLEAQLINYHQGNRHFAFMAPGELTEFDELNTLFFDVLAVKVENRSKSIHAQYPEIPYLNSSLFDPTELELSSLRISNLKDNLTLPPYKHTVLKDKQGHSLAKAGKSEDIPTLDYLLRFLDAFDFGSEGHKVVKRERKSLISASVLGLVFEKINGYREGSFFTPGFITMYMARETLRKTVLDKFNEKYGIQAENIEKLGSDLRYYKIGYQEANKVIDNLKVCDPAVGSGHFLVSVLNELISVKSDLGILMDANKQLISGYEVKVGNDELEVEDPQGNLFDYSVIRDADRQTRQVDREKQRIQKALFHEKRKLIENCLFGVDINANSVKICRLRLWIELLKNAYYREEENYAQLETLPNIDINIKEGNSLISRFPLDMDLNSIIKKLNQNLKTKVNLKDYQIAVQSYKETTDREAKEELQRYIKMVKDNFREELIGQSPINKKLSKVRGGLTLMENPGLFEDQKYSEKQIIAKRKELEKLKQEKADLENNVIYRNAFEWRFEFPEVLDEKGRFTGFDVVIGNPPYISIKEIEETQKDYYSKHYSTAKGQFDLYGLFIEISFNFLTSNGEFSMITSSTYFSNKNLKPLREFLLNKTCIQEIVNLDETIFKDAKLDVGITFFKKRKCNNNDVKVYRSVGDFINDDFFTLDFNRFKKFDGLEFKISLSPRDISLFEKLMKESKRLGEIAELKRGIEFGGNNDLISTKKTNDSELPLITGNNIEKFKVKDYTGYCIYDKADKATFKDFNLYAEPRILIQRIRNLSLSTRLIATYTDKKILSTNTLRILILNDTGYLYKYILGVLNSKLINYYFRKNFLNKDIYAYQLAQIPIKKAKIKEQKQIVKIVEEIEQLKTKNINSKKIMDTIKKLNQKVYELYGVTEEEVEIVENSFKN